MKLTQPFTWVSAHKQLFIIPYKLEPPADQTKSITGILCGSLKHMLQVYIPLFSSNHLT